MPEFVRITTPSPECLFKDREHSEHMFRAFVGAAAGANIDCPGVVLEQLYVVCRQCGESFDSLITAFDHKPGECGSEQGFDILPESEAM